MDAARLAKDTPKSQKTRARILDCAMHLIAEIGYHAATNPAIADAAGLTRGAMLYHFPTREALVEAAVAHIQAERSTLFRAAADSLPARMCAHTGVRRRQAVDFRLERFDAGDMAMRRRGETGAKHQKSADRPAESEPAEADHEREHDRDRRQQCGERSRPPPCPRTERKCLHDHPDTIHRGVLVCKRG